MYQFLSILCANPIDIFQSYQLMLILSIYVNSRQFPSILAGSCSPDDDNWKSFNGKCYYFSGTAVEGDPGSRTFRDAQAWCNENGANLASVHDQDVNDFIQGQVGGKGHLG